MNITKNAYSWLENILNQRFGNSFRIKQLENSKHQLSLVNSERYILINRCESKFSSSGDETSCLKWNSQSEGYISALNEPIPAPGLLRIKLPLVEHHSNYTEIHYDILALTYWMLTRQEEVGSSELDSQSRFPAIASHAFRHGYLERPIVDEWLDILGQVMLRVWPNLKLKQHEFKVQVSHDVDVPSKYAFRTIKSLARVVGGEVINNKNYKAALVGPLVWLNSRKRIHPLDPLNTFDWLMEQSEKNGLRSAFYFICGRTEPSKDALYEPESPQIRDLIRRIYNRGHEIGLHPSYNTYNRPDEIAKEAKRLFDVCKEEGVDQSEWGGRMHYLRWAQSITPSSWDRAGLDYDGTLGYADRPGFRCGTCFEYPWFDTVNDCELSLRVRPLIAMDCTVIAKRYLALGSTNEAYQKFNYLKENCIKVKGTFSLLWHNSFFKSKSDFEIYSRLIK